MALPILLGTLVTRCQQRANREVDGQVDPTEYKDLISEKYGEMHALISEKDPTYFATEVTIDLGDLSLPTDYLSTLSVDFVFDNSSGSRRPLDGPIAIQDRVGLVGISTGGPAFYYSLDAGTLTLYPTPSSGTYKHRYLPQPTDYSTSADSTSIDVITIWGRKFLIWGVAAIALHKGSESQERALAEEDKARQQLEYWACQRALTHAPRRPIAASAAGPYATWNSDTADWRWAR